MNHSLVAGARFSARASQMRTRISLGMYFKRIKDLLIASVMLTLLALPMLLIALIIRRDGGPAIYAHPRIGKDGKVFKCLKFRSMIVNSDDVLRDYLKINMEARAEWGADQKLRKDPRITRIGAFLRKTSLDELPQLMNVLRGEMSLVGPRPIVKDEVVRYGEFIRHYYDATPGITGLWQVSGRNDLSYDERVQLDANYVRHWSLWRDVKILFMTVPALLNRSGAY